jgi:hypothetical protein
VAKLRTIDIATTFIDESRLLGYEISGSVFKADYNGKSWSVGFWIRPSQSPSYKAKWKRGDEYYDLPGRCGKANDKSFRKAVKKAIERAKFAEEGKF